MFIGTYSVSVELAGSAMALQTAAQHLAHRDRLRPVVQALNKEPELFRPVVHMLYATTLFETMAANAASA